MSTRGIRALRHPLRESLGRGVRGAVDESAYRVRRARGATYFTHREEHDDLTVVVKRFPARESVPADAPTYVLVHGLGVSSRYFQPMAAELARRGHVLLIDLPGYGAAPDPRRDVGIRDHAEAVAAMIAASGLTDVVVVGHSMGSQVVSRMLLDHPEIVGPVVLMAPTMPPEARTPARAIGRLLLDALREPPSVFFIAVTDYLVRCGLPYLLRQLPHLLDDDVLARMPELERPVLVLCGDRDAIVPASFAAELAAAAPDGASETVRGPHVVMHTDPVTSAAAIVAFARSAVKGDGL